MKLQQTRNVSKISRKVTLVHVLIISSMVVIALGAILWYLLLPDSQSGIRQWILRIKFPTGKTYVQQVLQNQKTSDVSATGAAPVGIYKVPLSSGKFEEKYSLKRDMHTNTYAIAVNKRHVYIANQSEVKEYDLETGKVVNFYTEHDSSKQIIQVLQTYSSGVYVLELYNSDKMKSIEHVVRVSPDGTSEDVYAFRATTYEVVNSYFESDGKKYIVTSGGDGCGGGGRVLDVSGTTEREIAKFGLGCVEGPRFISILPGNISLLAAQILSKTKESESGVPNHCYYDVLYSQNIVTQVITPLYDLKKIPTCIESFSFDPVTNVVAIVGEQKVYLIDAVKREQVRTFPLQGTGYATWQLMGTMLSGFVYDQHEIRVVDISSGVTKKIPWNIVAQHDRYPYIAGYQDGSVIIVAQ